MILQNLKFAFEAGVVRWCIFGSALASITALSVTPAYAYLDPGSVSFMLQGVVGGIAAGATAVGIYWRRLKGIFSGRKRGDSPALDESEHSDRRD